VRARAWLSARRVRAACRRCCHRDVTLLICGAFHRGRSACTLSKAGAQHSIPTNLRQN
jgi:hypothetical protein